MIKKSDIAVGDWIYFTTTDRYAISVVIDISTQEDVVFVDAFTDSKDVVYRVDVSGIVEVRKKNLKR